MALRAWTDAPLVLGDWEVHRRHGIIVSSSNRESPPKQLGPRVMAVLVCLAQHAGNVVKPAEVIEEVWGERSPELAVLLVDELLSLHFDMPYTARLGPDTHWRDATTEQRERFGLALYRTLLRTYAGAVSEWTREQLKILPLRDDAKALQVIVLTEILRPVSALVRVGYRLHKTVDGWKVFDVIVGSISYIRNFHDDIDSVVQQKGLDSTIARLEKLNRDVPVRAPAESRAASERSPAAAGLNGLGDAQLSRATPRLVRIGAPRDRAPWPAPRRCRRRRSRPCGSRGPSRRATGPTRRRPTPSMARWSSVAAGRVSYARAQVFGVAVRLGSTKEK